MEINSRELVNLSTGGVSGFSILYFVSDNWILSLLVGTPLGVGGFGVAILAWRVILGNGAFSGNMWRVHTTKEKVRITVVIGLSATSAIILSYFFSDDPFSLLITVLFMFVVLANLLYEWIDDFLARRKESMRGE